MFPKLRAGSTSRAVRRLLVIVGCLVGVLAPASAQAAPDVSVSPMLSGVETVAVGDVRQGQLIVANHSTAPENTGSLKLTELTLVPSCGAQFADPACAFTPPGADVGVINVGEAATGSGACSGISFAVAVSDILTGRVSFAPSSPVVLGTGPASSTCTVSFTYTVGRAVTKDSSSASGKQTDLVAFVKSTASVVPNKQAADQGYETVTVVRDTPVLTTLASASVETGGELSVAATLNGTHPDGNISFDLFGPTDPTCSGIPMSTSTIEVNGNGTYRSTAVVASQSGTYRWKAAYGGDDDNDAVGSACNEPAAATVVRSSPLPPVTTPPAGGGNTSAAADTGANARAGKSPIASNAATGVRLDSFGLSPRTFVRASGATALVATAAGVTRKSTKAKKAVKGTTIRYTLSGPAIVTIVVERALKGRRSGKTCAKATSKLKRKKSCTRYVKVSTLTRTHTSAGAKTVLFSGRVGRRALPLGSYRMRATASAGSQTTSSERKATFKIVKSLLR
jgi:hypothetical protein